MFWQDEKTYIISVLPTKVCWFAPRGWDGGMDFFVIFDVGLIDTFKAPGGKSMEIIPYIYI